MHVLSGALNRKRLPAGAGTHSQSTVIKKQGAKAPGFRWWMADRAADWRV